MGIYWYWLAFLPDIVTLLFYLGILTVAIVFLPRFRFPSTLVVAAILTLLASHMLSVVPTFMARGFGQFWTLISPVLSILTMVLHAVGISLLVWAVYAKRPDVGIVPPSYPAPPPPSTEP